MLRQTIIPLRWVIVDDGSTDGTAELIKRASQGVPWIRVIHRPNRGYRKSGGGVIEAFNDGYLLVENLPWEFIVKLDGDLSFSAMYFQSCLEMFLKSPSLGIGGGTIYTLNNGSPKIDSPKDPPFHVRGATKIYRRDCWEKISPLITAPGWDTVDEVKANMLGWQTMTFPDIPILQCKETGSGEGTWHNWKKNGLANYVAGYHPIFMFAKCLARLAHNPLAGAGLFVGYLQGLLKAYPKVSDPNIVKYLRNQQMRRLTFRKSIYNNFRKKRF